MFAIHEKNIPQIKATIKAFGKCYFHGDGNLYSEESDSDFRQNFSNPKNEHSQYRILFTNENQVPATVEELTKKLMESRSQELIQGRVQKTVSPVKTVKVDESSKDLTDDEKLQLEIEAEEKAKANKS